MPSHLLSIPPHEITRVLAPETQSAGGVGQRGIGQISALLLGSVSQRLAGLAPLPVTVVP